MVHWIGARNPNALKDVAGLNNSLDMIERGMEYLYHKAIALRQQTIIDEGTPPMLARERAVAYVEAHYIHPSFTRAMKGSTPKETWSMNEERLGDLKAWLDNDKHFISANNTDKLSTKHQIGNKPAVLDVKLPQLHREQVALRVEKGMNPVAARYEVNESVCQLKKSREGNLLWHLHDDGAPLLRELLSRPPEWIKSNQDKRLQQAGLTGRKELLDQYLPDHFSRLVEQEQVETEIKTGKPITQAQAQQQVEQTKLRRSDELRFAGDGWEINESYAAQLAREVPELRVRGVQDWVSISRKGYVLKEMFPEIEKDSRILSVLQEMAPVFYNTQIDQTRRHTHLDYAVCMDEVERNTIFHDMSCQTPVWRIHRDAMPAFRQFVDQSCPDLLQSSSRQLG